MIIQPEQPEQPPQPPQPGDLPVRVARKPRKKTPGGKVNSARLAKLRRRGGFKRKKTGKKVAAKNTGKTRLTKDKVEDVIPIDQLVNELGKKPSFKNKFSCK